MVRPFRVFNFHEIDFGEKELVRFEEVPCRKCYVDRRVGFS